MMSSILQPGQGPPTRKGVSLISKEFDAFLSPVSLLPEYQAERSLGQIPRIGQLVTRVFRQ